MPSRSRNGDVIDEASAPVRESQSTRGQESSVSSELRQCLSVDDRNRHAGCRYVSGTRSISPGLGVRCHSLD
ncbi:hypothetical protein B296_00047904 [Ensete ventricosum]|uniref:Uncharacterized protein n=1 Tax=Ensete ventricosum TaxID=4639 RepID=A0A426YXF6_ENSVE|nr:hypothetical protein B296_00047904 [Ensete ventricosum]